MRVEKNEICIYENIDYFCVKKIKSENSNQFCIGKKIRSVFNEIQISFVLKKSDLKNSDQFCV